ncbi:hypothetical protein COX95_04575 [bacterium CG_4_10_14_0_2_um_filter_33_32]|nr:MAG: hypothetical protein AUJ93_03700 [bacterium CG2_30_33_46]PIR67683.1 MAG: hypothetical protein COU50_01905 [bacterium CG10_big_fil_rev_8_21_14_0_10_33_18]PIU76407.1 MAG: hypothetical protein COS74_04105 [bacterium CG06_land_8_20_14_3_00_33_50]PIW81054.1 MAG: hypothetical protein COZ97_03705 [bacterium CG_4_8_14_3_um_filter_33_28]PIY85794.1 MAG: hypothetical protein COY76_00220 [bacterium CG_4_10_14_0_8_um_filter_33_57]PIZ85272.1 MAG: hypothetical protein COX95_04575 [bacterium CG_4_10_1
MEKNTNRSLIKKIAISVLLGAVITLAFTSIPIRTMGGQQKNLCLDCMDRVIDHGFPFISAEYPAYFGAASILTFGFWKQVNYISFVLNIIFWSLIILGCWQLFSFFNKIAENKKENRNN